MPTKENHYTAGDASVWQEEGTDKFFLPKKTAQFKVFSCDAKIFLHTAVTFGKEFVWSLVIVIGGKMHTVRVAQYRNYKYEEKFFL